MEFGVASCHHMAGAYPKYIDHHRFKDYDSAQAYARTFKECVPTIYLIVNNRYAFYCERSKVENGIAWVYSIESKPWGQVETRIWWRDFQKNPEAFLHLAVGEIGC
jgi:hypothetical protein